MAKGYSGPYEAGAKALERATEEMIAASAE